MRRGALVTLVAFGLGCVTTPLDVGERRYREGDRRGALEAWREVDPDDRRYPEVAARIAAVEAESESLVLGYRGAGDLRESEGRLAESLLDYRLAFALQPDDPATLAHVQRLARELASRKLELREQYDRVRASGDLLAARDALALLRNLDPFDPEYEIEEGQLQADLATERQRRQARIRASRVGEVEALLESGRAAFREEQLETALRLWRRAQLMDPDNERLQAYIARAERQLDSLERLRATPEANGGP